MPEVRSSSDAAADLTAVGGCEYPTHAGSSLDAAIRRAVAGETDMGLALLASGLGKTGDRMGGAK